MIVINLATARPFADQDFEKDMTSRNVSAEPDGGSGDVTQATGSGKIIFKFAA